MDDITKRLIDTRIKNNDIYVQSNHIMQLYDISRTTIWRICSEMRLIPKYKNAFRDLSYNKKLVHLATFEKFLEEKHSKYLKN